MPALLTLDEIHAQLAAHVAELDAGSLRGPEAARAMTKLGKIRKLTEAGELLLAPRVRETEAWRGDGHRSCADWMAAQTGGSVGEAASVLQAAERLDALPATATAVRAGELSGDQARIVTDAAIVDRASESALLATAQRDTHKNLKAHNQQVKAAATDDRTRRERVHRNRSVRQWIDGDSAANLLLTGPADKITRIWELVKPLSEQVFHDGRRAKLRDTHENRMFDAFMRLVDRLYVVGLDDPAAATAGLSAADTPDTSGDAPKPGKRRKVPRGANAQVNVVVDLDGLLRGFTVPGETAHVEGLGQVPIAVIRELMNDAFISVCLKKGRDVVNVAHSGRGLNRHQRTALEATRIECSNIACNCTVAIQADHRYPYNADPITKLDNQDLLCTTDHLLKTHHGWMLEPGTGRRRFLPPDHPDHPGPPTPPTSRDDMADEGAAERHGDAASPAGPPRQSGLRTRSTALAIGPPTDQARGTPARESERSGPGSRTASADAGSSNSRAGPAPPDPPGPRASQPQLC